MATVVVVIVSVLVVAVVKMAVVAVPGVALMLVVVVEVVAERVEIAVSTNASRCRRPPVFTFPSSHDVFSADANMMLCTSKILRSLKKLTRSAAAPATYGVAIDVPLNVA